MHHLGKNLKYLRKKMSKTQAELALIVGKGQTTIGNWENGESEPSLEELILLSNFSGFSIDNLLKRELESNGDDVGENIKPVSKLISDPAFLNLVSQFQSLKKEVEQLKKKLKNKTN